MPHPYDESGRRPAADVPDFDDLIDRAVQAGTRVGSEVLGSIADALQQAMTAGRPRRAPADEFAVCRRKLERRLENSYAGWLTAGITGWFFAFGLLVSTIVMVSLVAAAPPAAGTLLTYRPVFEVLGAAFAVLTVGAGVLGAVGVHFARRSKRLRSYLRALRGWRTDLAAIARGAARPPETVRSDLCKAIAAGSLGSACYDAEADAFYLDGSRYQPPAAPTPAPAPPTAAQAFDRQCAEFDSYLGLCRGHLPADADGELAAMRRNCAAIRAFVAAHPEQLPRVRRFAEYYLPTTRKLLDTALGLTDTETDSARTIRRDITGILHTLNTAYEKLYDTLLQEVSLDISAEIDTLETMLGQDGLTKDFKTDFGQNAR